MTSETTLQTSCNQENAELEECSENIPPGATTDMSKVQGDENFSAQTNSENKPLSESCTFSTPAPTSSTSSGAKKKSQLSGLQLALTPILKYLNIGSKCPSSEPSSCGSSPQPGSPSLPTVNCQKLAGGRGGRSSGDKDSPVDWLHDECLPDITLLDCTHDSTMQTTHTEAHATPHMPPLKRSKHNCTGTDLKMPDTPSLKIEPERWMDDRYFPEITLLDVTRDPELSPAAPEGSPMDVAQEIPPVDVVEHSRPLPELSTLVVSETDKPDVMQTEELSTTLTGSIAPATSSFSQQSKCALENVKSLEPTWDISMGGNDTENMKSEETLGVRAANVTHNLSSASSTSAASQPSDLQSNTSLKNLTADLHVEPMETSNRSDAGDKEPPPSSKDTTEPQRSPDTAGSANGTFTPEQPADVSASTDPAPCPQNEILEVPPTEAEVSKEESVATNQVSSEAKNTTEISLDQNGSPAMSGSSGDLQNGTFDIHSLQKSSGSSSTLGEAGVAFSLQNNTYDGKPACKQNGTLTLSETSVSNGQQNTFTQASPSKPCNQTSSPKDKTFDVHTPEDSKPNESTDVKMADAPERTFEAKADVASAANETKDHSESKMDSLSESLSHRGLEAENNKAHTFNLDDTLDLKVDSLVTSTPMPHGKAFDFNAECDEGKAEAAKRLSGDGASQPAVQAPSAVRSNIISNRKTLLPPLKSQLLLKYKASSSAVPRKSEASKLPMTRQRSQAEALKILAPADAPPGSTGILSSYNLRATTIALSYSGLPKPQLSGIPSGTLRSASGLKPPLAKSITGLAVTNPGSKITQSKKHPLPKAEPLPSAKRKKPDTSTASIGADAPTFCGASSGVKIPKRPGTGCNQRASPPKPAREDAAAPASAAAAGRARALRPPVNNHRTQPAKPQAHGCAKCVSLEEQLRIKCEEIKRLKEELLKYSKQGGE